MPLIFQEQLACTDGRIGPLCKVEREADILASASTHWRWVWQNVNYIPIFQIGERGTIDEETLSQTTPLYRKHINPFGRYNFDVSRMRNVENTAGLLPLNGGFRLDAVTTPICMRIR